jgi:FKBP-type peptidyl-prolyl cis-trans isomerase FkpA
LRDSERASNASPMRNEPASIDLRPASRAGVSMVANRRVDALLARPRGAKLLPVLGLVAAYFVGCGDKVAEPDTKPKPPPAAPIPEPSDLQIEDLTPGTGDRTVKEGDTVFVHYVGKLLRGGSKFDENKPSDPPFEFTVGEGVIEGWSQGVVGMKRGGKRKLTIPSKLAYGERGSPPKIPANAPLVFEVELVRWKGDPETAPAAEPAAPAAGSAAPAAGSAAPKVDG